MTARQRHRAEVFERDSHLCALRPEKTGWPGQGSEAGECSGRLQADHILKITALERRQAQLQMRTIKAPGSLTTAQLRFAQTDPDVLIADARNGWILCERHHGLKDRRLLVVVEEILLPMDFVDFVVDFELGDLAGTELRPRAMAGSPHGAGRAGGSEPSSRGIRGPGYPRGL